MSATHAPAVDHGDHGNRQAADGHRQAEHAVVPHIGIGEVQAFHRVEIAAGGKRLVALAGNHRADDGRVFACGFQGIDHLIEGLFAEGVQHLLAIDGDPGHLVLHFVQDVGVVAFVRLFRFRCHCSPRR